jgi:hypothetical protein
MNITRTPRAPRETARRSIGLAAARAASRVEPLESRVLFSADAIRDLDGFYTNTLGAVDDRSVLTSLNFESPINFYGGSYDTVWVNNNGNLSFGAAFSSYRTTSLDLLASRMIAPFFADIDNRLDGMAVTYGSDIIDGHAAFGVNYFNVNYYPSGTSHVNKNTFQVILIDRSDIAPGAFDIEFNYASIQWESGGLAGGDVNGWGGTSGRVGFTAGMGGIEGTFFQLDGSGVAGSFLDSNSLTGLANTSMNSDVTGRYVFAFRDGVWVPKINTAPTLSVPGDTTVVEGADGRTRLPLGFAGLFADPDADQWTATVCYGDGGEEMPLSLNEDQSFSLVHTYDQPGVYTVIVRLSDGNGGEAMSSFQVSVVDRSAPVVDVSAPRAYEGGSVTLRASTLNDLDANDVYSFEWMIDGNVVGTGEEYTMSVPDSGTVFVTMIAKDQWGNATTAQVPVVVENLAPTATFGASTGSIKEGQSVNFSFSGGADASAADMAAGLTYSFDFNGDGVFDVTGASPSVSHTFARDGVYVVTGRVMDKDGGYTDYKATVNVANIAPVITSFTGAGSNGNNSVVTPHGSLAVSGGFFDPDQVDHSLVTIDWGDGTRTSGVQLQQGADGSWTFSALHDYSGGGLYTVTLYVNDGTETVTASLSAKVSGAKV